MRQLLVFSRNLKPIFIFYSSWFAYFQAHTLLWAQQTIPNAPFESNLNLAFWQEMLAVQIMMNNSNRIALMLESGRKLWGEKLEKRPPKTRFAGLFQRP